MRSLVLLTAFFFTLLVASPLVGNTGSDSAIVPVCEANLPKETSCFQKEMVRFYVTGDGAVEEVFHRIKGIILNVHLEKETTINIYRSRGSVCFLMQVADDAKGFVSWRNNARRETFVKFLMFETYATAEEMAEKIKTSVFSGNPPFIVTAFKR